MIFRLFAVATALAIGACGGSSAPATSGSGRTPGHGFQQSPPLDMGPGGAPANQPPEPITITVRSTRVGNSVLLDITGTGGRRPANHPMERAENWAIRALAGDLELERKVNGSVKVERFQVGNPAWGLWDIEVHFSVAYAVPEDAEEITVKVSAPESEMHEEILAIGLAPAKKSAAPENKSRPKSPGKSGRKAGQKAKSPK
jgi:hypothetical protein